MKIESMNKFFEKSKLLLAPHLTVPYNRLILCWTLVERMTNKSIWHTKRNSTGPDRCGMCDKDLCAANLHFSNMCRQQRPLCQCYFVCWACIFRHWAPTTTKTAVLEISGSYSSPVAFDSSSINSWWENAGGSSYLAENRFPISVQQGVQHVERLLYIWKKRV